MTDQSSADFRRLAGVCRRQADATSAQATKDVLNNIAQDYERKAVRMDAVDRSAK